MDINEMRATVTLIGLMLFVWLVLHTWSRRRKADHDEAANLPFAGEAQDNAAPSAPKASKGTSA